MKYHILSLGKDLGFIKSVIHPVVLETESGLILFDAGYPGQLDDFKSALAAIGFSISDLYMIVISHHDHDHMGSLKAILDENPSIVVVSGTAEEAYVSGEAKSLRLEQAEEYNQTLTGDARTFGDQFAAYLATIEPVKVRRSVGDNEALCPGVRVIHTSGHTPGHISLYLEEEEILLAGDALAIEDGKLIIPNIQFTLNLEEAGKSVEKIRNMKISKIICYHGNSYDGDAGFGLDQLLEDFA